MTGAIALALLVAARSATAEADEPSKPNIVFLFADDLGYGDLACYGHPYARTPNLDRLASQGTRFTKFYVTGVSCCPSRTGIMTSKFPANFAAYPADAGFGDRVTVTELLKKSGYATGHFGKWHIGSDMRPGVYGFDATPQTDAERRRATSNKMRGRAASTYDGAIAFIEANKDRPFYVNVWGSITHHAVNPIPKFVDEFRDLVVDESDFPLAMREKFALAKARGGDISDGMRRYLGDVYSLDLDVGRLLGRLDDLGLSDNTIVIFSSDHGSPSMPPPGVLTAEQKRALRQNTNADVTIVGPDLSLNLMGFNGGFRGGKHTMYEGGVRVPFIIRWIGHVPAGRVDETSVISGIDWLPTLCAIAGVKIDTADFDGEDV